MSLSDTDELIDTWKTRIEICPIKNEYCSDSYIMLYLCPVFVYVLRRLLVNNGEEYYHFYSVITTFYNQNSCRDTTL